MSAAAEFQVELAELRVEVRHLAHAVGELKGDVKDLTTALNQARGGWKVIGAIAGLGGAIAGALTSALIKLKLGG
jgi:hypothetical protein